MKRNHPFPAALVALTTVLAVGMGRAQNIQPAAAMPVTGQTLILTVPGLGAGGIITCTDSRGTATQLTTNSAGQATWTPSRYGKYTLSCGATTQTMWVTARPMTFHWWNATLAQANVTTVMSDASDWQARGVTTVKWTGGEAYSRGIDGHWWTQPTDWTNGWSSANTAGGMAIDEAYCDGRFPTDQIVQAAAMERLARAANYSINLWSSGFGSGFAADAAILKANNVTVLIEDYNGDWDLHVSRWADACSYGLQSQAILGIWPSSDPLNFLQTPLSTADAVRADMAWVRLAAPDANGIAIFDATSDLLAATDQAIEDYFLKPLIYLSLPANGQLNVRNLGNDDATGFSLQFLNATGTVLQTVDLSGLAANSQQSLTIPSGAVNAAILNPSGTANLYAANSRYPNDLYPLSVPGRYVWNNGNGDNLWSTVGNWSPSGPPPGNLDSHNFACFDGSVTAPTTVTAKSGETSIKNVQFATAGWTLAGNPTTQDIYAYSITSSGTGTNTINIGVSARDVVPAIFAVETGNTLVVNGLVGAARNSGGLTKNGLGTLVLTYANTFTGGTTVNSGTLLLNGSLSTGPVTVAAAGTLGGTGTAAGTVTVNGTVAPGIGIGTLTAASLSLAGHYRCEIDGTAADKLVVTGALDLTGATLNVSLLAGGFTQPHYVIATCGSLTGTFASVPAGYQVQYHQGSGANEIWLEEPAGYAAWALLHTGGQAANLDYNHDGIPNGIAFFMGVTGPAAHPGIAAGKVTWPKGAAYTGACGTDYIVQTSTDLSTWTDVPPSDPNLSDGSPLRYTLSTAIPKCFVRLKVTGP